MLGEEIKDNILIKHSGTEVLLHRQQNINKYWHSFQIPYIFFLFRNLCRCWFFQLTVHIIDALVVVAAAAAILTVTHFVYCSSNFFSRFFRCYSLTWTIFQWGTTFAKLSVTSEHAEPSSICTRVKRFVYTAWKNRSTPTPGSHFGIKRADKSLK